MSSIKLALVQTDLLWEDVMGNLLKFDTILADIDSDTEIVILPEVFSTGFSLELDKMEKPIGHKALKWLKQKAILLKMTIVGSILFEENKKYYNRMFWVRSDGRFDYYDKRHLFQMGNEHKIMTTGDKRVVVSHKNINFMLQVCYDLRFPIWSKNKYDKTTKRHDYDAIIYIAHWPEVRKKAYMDLLKARAIENQAYVVWVNRVGKNNLNENHSGDTQVIDPQGNIIKQMPENKEGILYTSLNTDKLKAIRRNFKVGLDWDVFEV